MSLSLYEQLKSLPRDKQEAITARLDNSLMKEMGELPWWLLARPEQIPPKTNWHVWLILAGRGFGKTRSCAEWLANEVLMQPTASDGTPTEWAIIAETFSDTRTVCVEGPSGILRAFGRRGLTNGNGLLYNKSAWQILLDTGQRIHMIGADNPDAGRGYNLAGVWADEVAKWRYPYETWVEGIAPALRIGTNPRAVVATTPKPNKLLKDWVSRTDGSVYVTRGSTFDNASNLSATALVELQARYEGTRIGRQELYGELLEDVDGALWNLTRIEETRLSEPIGRIVRRVVAVDPAVTNNADSDETGIIICARDDKGNGYVEADVSMKGTPDAWARAVVRAFDEYECDAIVVEVNQGGDMVAQTLRTVRPRLPIKEVRASKGKRLRAEPISALYEQGRIHHLGVHELLEEQMCSWTPDDPKSPDRLDALVHGLTELMEGGGAAAYLRNLAVVCACGFPNVKGTENCTSCGAILKAG